LGIAMLIPHDGRIKLTFYLPWQWKYEELQMRLEELTPPERELTQEEVERLQEKVVRKMQDLRRLDKEMRKLGDFCILDTDFGHQDPVQVVYRLGEPRARVVGKLEERYGYRSCCKNKSWRWSV